jgi:hypothetical protein
MGIPGDERLKVWTRSAGRCAICGRDLLDGSLTGRVNKLGELAHIVGQQDTDGSPRGRSALTPAERDSAGNLLLLCPGEHMEIDRGGALDLMTVERLRKIKIDHESWVRRMTGLERARGTAVLRVIGDVHGVPVELTKATCADAVVECEDRFPEFPLSYDEYGVEIDLRGIPGEAAPGAEFWASASRRIDEVLQHKLADAVRGSGQVRHISVFAFARLPLLMHLGARLDDTTPVTVYDRHRDSQSWVWPSSDVRAAFATGWPERPAPGDEAVLVLNVSGSIQTGELPEDLAGLPRFEITATHTTPSPGILRSLGDLIEFSNTLRTLFATIEARDKHIRRLHVFAALPVSAAVELGRVHVPHVHPDLAIYSRESDGAYYYALEVS